MDAIAIDYRDWESLCDKRPAYGQDRGGDDRAMTLWDNAIKLQAEHSPVIEVQWISRWPTVQYDPTSTTFSKNQTVATAMFEKRFLEYAEKWERETGHLSSTTKRVMHPSYQSILGMGDSAIPLMLRDLQQTQRLWFWALTHITGENPVDPQDAGDLEAMTEAWIVWGKRKNLI